MFVMRFDKVLLFSKLTFSCHVKNKMLMQLKKDSEPIESKYVLLKVKLKNNLFKNSYQKMVVVLLYKFWDHNNSVFDVVEIKTSFSF